MAPSFSERLVAGLARASVRTTSTDRVLVIRSTSLGDFVVLLPYLATLSRNMGGAEIDLLMISRTGDVSAALLRAWHGRRATVDPTTLRTTLRGAQAARRSLRRGAYGRVLLARQAFDDPRTLLKRLAIARFVGGLSPLTGWETHSLLRQCDVLARDHAVVPVNQALAPFLATNISPAVSRSETLQLVSLPEEDRAQTWAGASLDERPLIAMHVHAKDAHKQWPSSSFELVGTWLRNRLDAALLFVGGPDDTAPSRELADALGIDERAVVAGKLSPGETIALLQRCTAFVGNDASPMHMAALAGIPTIGVFSNIEPPGTWEPIAAPRSVSVRPPEGARGAQGHGIDLVRADVVIEAIEFVLNANGGGHRVWCDNGRDVREIGTVSGLFALT